MCNFFRALTIECGPGIEVKAFTKQEGASPAFREIFPADSVARQKVIVLKFYT